jgi:hypothetical protein
VVVGLARLAPLANIDRLDAFFIYLFISIFELFVVAFREFLKKGNKKTPNLF